MTPGQRAFLQRLARDQSVFSGASIGAALAEIDSLTARVKELEVELDETHEGWATEALSLQARLAAVVALIHTLQRGTGGPAWGSTWAELLRAADSRQ